KGIDSPLTKIVEDDGTDLSGGEKQKLALAKALYKGAKIVVLDEPTSALDAIAEQTLYERFDEMIGDKSAVYISHRLASTRFCDRIAMFEEGTLAEYGSHDELMARNGKYADMFNIQAQYYREDAGSAESGVTANA
ncbi:MAG: ATP-binding cassette domain-containing protein, partial [Lachnospiraceae bacterium]|nr:ATP-binding cassette domain-containing protein [Lachnospiraceae bacterium]